MFSEPGDMCHTHSHACTQKLSSQRFLGNFFMWVCVCVCVCVRVCVCVDDVLRELKYVTSPGSENISFPRTLFREHSQFSRYTCGLVSEGPWQSLGKGLWNHVLYVVCVTYGWWSRANLIFEWPGSPTIRVCMCVCVGRWCIARTFIRHVTASENKSFPTTLFREHTFKT